MVISTLVQRMQKFGEMRVSHPELSVEQIWQMVNDKYRGSGRDSED